MTEMLKTTEKSKKIKVQHKQLCQAVISKLIIHGINSRIPRVRHTTQAVISRI